MSRSSSKNDSGERNEVYYSTVQFTTEDNQVIKTELDIANGVEEAIGTEKKVIYDPQSPENAQADNQFFLISCLG